MMWKVASGGLCRFAGGALGAADLDVSVVGGVGVVIDAVLVVGFA